MWKCARASYILAFNKKLDALNMLSPEACDYLKKIDPYCWTMSHFRTQFKCDMLLNIQCEYIILEARTKGIVTMNEIIRTMLIIKI